MNEEIMQQTVEYAGRVIQNMLLIFDAPNTAEEKEQTLRYGAACATYMFEESGLSTEESREAVIEGIIALVKEIHKGDANV